MLDPDAPRGRGAKKWLAIRSTLESFGFDETFTMNRFVARHIERSQRSRREGRSIHRYEGLTVAVLSAFIPRMIGWGFVEVVEDTVHDRTYRRLDRDQHLEDGGTP